MKKSIVFILLVALLFTLAGCTSKNSDPNKVAERYFYSLLDGDTKEFMSCINKNVLDNKLIQNEVSEDEFMKELQTQVYKIKNIFEEKGLEKEDFKIYPAEYKDKTTVVVKIVLNKQEMQIPLYKNDDGNWYIIDKFIDGIIQRLSKNAETGLNEL